MENSVLIIAEAGVNHNGDINLAKKLAAAAFSAGADIVKFQSFDPDNLVIPSAKTALYQNKNTQENYQIELLRKLQLSGHEQVEIFNYCNDIGIEFLSTGFEKKSLNNLVNLGIKRIKIPSGEITNTPLLEFIGSSQLPIILSTGMSNLLEIETALNTLQKNGAAKDTITILHCTSNYPATDDELNLRALTVIADSFNTEIGYSDHSLGKEASIAAVTLGAKIIEKHITLDRSMPGPDHKASMEIIEFQDFVKSIRKTEIMLGEPTKEPTFSEQTTLTLVRKSIVALTEVKAGDLFSIDNVTTKRPGTGLSAVKWHDVIGKTSKRNYQKNELIDDKEI
ncbi:N-acetylneuraminate synthase [Alphaproteobacteria bacterium]|nr:N-acetylneuraminate synthase [Alphaproteobacteria bacterium]